MVVQDFQADQDQDRASENFGFRAEFRGDVFTDENPRGRNRKGGRADERGREQDIAQRTSVVEMYFHEAEAESCDQCVDAQRDAEHQRVPQRKQVAIHLVVLDGGESFANHLGAEEREQEEGDPMAIWAWGELAVDFIQEEGAWKIWHLHYFRYMKCDYKKGWVDDTSMINRPNIPLNPLADASTYHNPYSPSAIRDGIPCAPKPYQTYTDADKNWELDRNKNW